MRVFLGDVEAMMEAKVKKISDRAAILLTLIIDWTHHDDAGRLTRYWIPIVGRQPSASLGGSVYVNGGGDAAALKSLAKRGFIKDGSVGRYSALATEEGRRHFERQIRETGRLEDLRRIVARHEAVLNGPQQEEEQW